MLAGVGHITDWAPSEQYVVAESGQMPLTLPPAPLLLLLPVLPALLLVAPLLLAAPLPALEVSSLVSVPAMSSHPTPAVMIESAAAPIVIQRIPAVLVTMMRSTGHLHLNGPRWGSGAPSAPAPPACP